MDKTVKCPVCGKGELSYWGQECSSCGWEYDDYQYENPDTYVGMNGMSVNDLKIGMKMYGDGFTLIKLYRKFDNDRKFHDDFLRATGD